MFGFYFAFSNCHLSICCFSTVRLYSDTPGVIIEEEQPYTAQFPPEIIH